MPIEIPEKHAQAWGIGKQVLSFIGGVIAAAFVLGSARQRVNDLSAWKAETAPRIERIDSKGTLSFEFFQKEYEKQQAKQEKRLEELEKESKQFETMKLKIDGLERANLDRQGRLPPHDRR